MPFTAAHPVLVLPFIKSRLRLSTTGLVAGSVAPDFEFFAQLREVDNIGHQWYGILAFDLPVALLGCVFFHQYVRYSLLANLPNYFKQRFSHTNHQDWTQYAFDHTGKVVFSIVIGIATHLLWDGFTHADGLFVERIPALQQMIPFLNNTLPVYYLLQILFSVGGMWIIGRSFHQMPRQNRAANLEGARWYWPLFALVFCFILLFRLQEWPEYNGFWSIVMATLGAACYSLLAVSVTFYYKRLKTLSL